MQVRNAVIANAVLADIQRAREDAMKRLAKIAPLAIRRIEDSTLPLRRRKVQDGDGTERTELDPSYSPPKVDTVGALFVLVDILGLKAGDEAPVVEAPKMVNKFEVVVKPRAVEISRESESGG